MKKLLHPVVTVSEATPLKVLLKRMQQERVHLAILIDQYGGTSGLVTIEDILEEIVGKFTMNLTRLNVKELKKLKFNVCHKRSQQEPHS